MSKFLPYSLMAVALASAAPAWGDDAKRDADDLQGTWQATEGIGNGTPLTKDQLQRLRVMFAGAKMSVFPLDGGEKAMEHTFQVDPGKKPKAIDATRLEGGGKGKVVKGIYDLDGDTLRLCLPARLEKERPTEFAAPENSGLVLLTLRRAKK